MKPSTLYLTLSATLGAVFAISAGVFADDSVNVTVRGETFSVCSASAASALKKWEFQIDKIEKNIQGLLEESERLQAAARVSGVPFPHEIFETLYDRLASIASRNNDLITQVLEISSAIGSEIRLRLKNQLLDDNHEPASCSVDEVFALSQQEHHYFRLYDTLSDFRRELWDRESILYAQPRQTRK